ncbi:hypothetical protein FCV25MIE_28999 [Fagus crenata]
MGRLTHVWKPKPTTALSLAITSDGLQLQRALSSPLKLLGGPSSLKTLDYGHGGGRSSNFPNFTKSPSGVDTSNGSSIISVEPRVEILTPILGGAVDRLWGSSLAWMLELRNGRRVSIPVSLICTPAGMEEDEALTQGMICLSGDVGSGSEVEDQRL